MRSETVRSSCSRVSTRRDFLKVAMLGSSATVLTLGTEFAAAGQKPSLVDVNVSLGHWPGRHLTLGEPRKLVDKLRSRGVTQAWTGSLDSLLHKDIAGVNSRLADDCHLYGRGLLLPFGAVHPGLPGWEEDLRRCVEVHRFAGIRLHPSYHGYKLNSAEFARLSKMAAENQLLVQLALVMEDERMMHPLLRVQPVDVSPLADLVRQTPGLRIVLINALRTVRGQALQELLSTGRVWVDISMVEGVGGLASLLGQVSASRVLFGSHAPLFYFEAAELKLAESALDAAGERAIRFENAKRLLPLNRGS